MAIEWLVDKKRMDIHIREAAQIVGGHLLVAAPDEEDQKRNTDLMMLKMRPVRVALRIRDWMYFERYRDEFTIRVGRPTGAKTELEKILLDKYGDYLFYGFEMEHAKAIHEYTLIDLAAFEAWRNRWIQRHVYPPGIEKVNRDGSSFVAFEMRHLDPGVIVGRGPGLKREMYMKAMEDGLLLEEMPLQ